MGLQRICHRHILVLGERSVTDKIRQERVDQKKKIKAQLWNQVDEHESFVWFPVSETHVIK